MLKIVQEIALGDFLICLFAEAITANYVVTVSLVSFSKKRNLKIVSISVKQQLTYMCLNCLHYFDIKKGASQNKKVVEYFSNSISTYVLYNINIR